MLLRSIGRNTLIGVWSPAGTNLDLTLLKVHVCLDGSLWFRQISAFWQLPERWGCQLALGGLAGLAGSALSELSLFPSPPLRYSCLHLPSRSDLAPDAGHGSSGPGILLQMARNDEQDSQRKPHWRRSRKGGKHQHCSLLFFCTSCLARISEKKEVCTKAAFNNRGIMSQAVKGEKKK